MQAATENKKLSEHIRDSIKWRLNWPLPCRDDLSNTKLETLKKERKKKGMWTDVILTYAIDQTFHSPVPAICDYRKY